ncbi:MAG: SDR family oxidoreductase [Janthinobacterium lividum]
MTQRRAVFRSGVRDAANTFARFDKIPISRDSSPGFAGVVGFLCGEASSYITGQTITVDGGTLNS